MADIVGMVLAQQFDVNAIANRQYVGMLIQKEEMGLEERRTALVVSIGESISVEEAKGPKANQATIAALKAQQTRVANPKAPFNA